MIGASIGAFSLYTGPIIPEYRVRYFKAIASFDKGTAVAATFDKASTTNGSFDKTYNITLNILREE